ncbi:hypothetical protein LCGC14_0258770 [marine sediment metagenome]|uniref:IPT/TIG domain-containing protein n=1 Tax=marine sediment metagenome TaxID=412755 RepID=A0A0F9UJ91_9ZZZZ
MVPSIYTITPETSLASGRAVATLTGWGYKIPDDPPDGYLGDDVTPTVAVLVNGRAADAVAVLSDTEIQFLVPEYLGPPATMDTAVDVVVKNLDDDGDPIALEEATLEGGFTYKHPDLTAPSNIEWITRCFLRMLRRNIVDNVGISASPDYSDAAATQVTFVSGLPAVTLAGPDVIENKVLRDNETRVEDDGLTGKTRKNAPYTADVLYDIMLIGRDKIESQNLMEAAVRYFQRRPIFVFQAGPSDPTEIECQLFVEGTWAPADNEQDQTYTYSNKIRLQGIWIDDSSGLAAAGLPAPDQFFTDTYETEELSTEDIG